MIYRRLDYKNLSFAFDYNEKAFGSYDFMLRHITINPKTINNECVEHNIDFYTLLLHVISHEHLHDTLCTQYRASVGLELDRMMRGQMMSEKYFNYWLS